ncbi:MAG TPA: helix-turn-helix domain-containing protein [Tepidisphaeraceae bacterium]|jgi:DNA-directed RNA polymerase specialized sigma24 family protein|nr:helix-turn-helix domain-containing protein [Tepidisphaeraceae bacterium]
MTPGSKTESTMLTRQQHALYLHRRGWTRQRIAAELGIGLPAVSRLLQRALGSAAGEPATKIPRRPRPQRIRPLSLSHYV